MLVTRRDSHNQYATFQSADAVYATLFSQLQKNKRITTDEFLSALAFLQDQLTGKADYAANLINYFTLVTRPQIEIFSGVARIINMFSVPKLIPIALPTIVTDMTHLIAIAKHINEEQRDLVIHFLKETPTAQRPKETDIAFLVSKMIDPNTLTIALSIYKKVLNKHARRDVRSALKALPKQIELPPSILVLLKRKAIAVVRQTTPKRQHPATPGATQHTPQEDADIARLLDTDADYISEDESYTEEVAVQPPERTNSLEDLPSQDVKLAPLLKAISDPRSITIEAKFIVESLPSLHKEQRKFLLDEVMLEICNNEKTVDNSELFSHFSDLYNRHEGDGISLNPGQRTLLIAKATPTQPTSSTHSVVDQFIAIFQHILKNATKKEIVDRLVKLSQAQAMSPALLVLCINNWHDGINVEAVKEIEPSTVSLTIDALANHEEAAQEPINKKLFSDDEDNAPTRERHALTNFLARVAEGIDHADWTIELLTKIYSIVPKQEHLFLTKIIRDYHGIVTLGDRLARRGVTSEAVSSSALHYVQPSSAAAMTIISAGSSTRYAKSNAAPVSELYNFDNDPTDYYFDEEQCKEILNHHAAFTWLSPQMQPDFLKSLAKNYTIFTDHTPIEGEESGKIQYNRLISQIDTMDSYDLRIAVLTTFVNPSTKADANNTHPLAFKELQCWMNSVSNYIPPDLAEISANIVKQNNNQSLSIVEALILEAQSDAQANSTTDAQSAQITAITTICHQCTIHIANYEFPMFAEGYFTIPEKPIIPAQYQGLMLLHMTDRIQITEGSLKETDPQAALFWERTQQHVTRFTRVLPYVAQAIQIANNYVTEKSGAYKTKDEKTIKANIKTELTNSGDSEKDSLTNDIWDLVRYYKIIKQGEAAGLSLQDIIVKLLDNTGDNTKAKFASAFSDKFRGISSPVKGVKQKLTNRNIDDQQTLAILMNDLITQLSRDAVDTSGHKKAVDPKFVFKALLVSAHYYNDTDHAFGPFTEAVPAPDDENAYLETATAAGGSTIAPSLRGGNKHRAATRKGGSITGSSMQGENRPRAVTSHNMFAHQSDADQLKAKPGTRAPSETGSRYSASLYGGDKKPRAVTTTQAPGNK